MKETLSPTIADLTLECVLVQAWKKTSAHIRYHSWYADTLELDYQSLRLPEFIKELQERLRFPDQWESTPLEMVLAPKTQAWVLNNGDWKPSAQTKVAERLRPLAHVGIHDQVIATAMMLCLAGRVETGSGDPRRAIKDPEDRRHVLSYGHRLYCDSDRNTNRLTHRWGSSKLYRQFFHDYQSFLERPKVVVSEDSPLIGDNEIAIVHSDLSRFYDRVRPALLHEKVRRLKRAGDDPQFFDLFEKVFDWKWSDPKLAEDYSKESGIEGFDSIALPQGLVAAGFFANVALIDFEAFLRDAIGTTIEADQLDKVLDICYYVDDLRIVLSVERGTDENSIELEVRAWLQAALTETAPGLLVERSKTVATVDGREKKFLVQQSKAAKRIQHEVSGTFDMLHGTELIGAIEGFFHTQQRYASSEASETNIRSGLLVGISDLRDDTAARFAAGKFRRTFRSLRPLLEGESSRTQESDETESDGVEIALPSQLVLSRQQLDKKAQLFAAMLIEEWVSNPSNVRLLRIALDMFPEAAFLTEVLTLLRGGWSNNGSRGPARNVKLYCLAEIFRAGATETGIVKDEDCLPEIIDLEKYHVTLTTEALEIFESSEAKPNRKKRFPWYLMQQVYLYLAAQNAFPRSSHKQRKQSSDKLLRYKTLARLMHGSQLSNLRERAIYLVLSITAFGHDAVLADMAKGVVSGDFIKTLAGVSPEVAEQLWNLISDSATDDQRYAARSLGLFSSDSSSRGGSTVGKLASLGRNPFYEEENLLILAEFLFSTKYSDLPETLTPWQIDCRVNEEAKGHYFGSLDPDSIKISDRLPVAKKLFKAPDWCEVDDERQCYKVGLILRYALRGSLNFHASDCGMKRSGTAYRYRRPVSHWEQQQHSSFQGRSSFGPPWLPISSYVEDLLFELLRWPGCGVSNPTKSLEEIGASITVRLKELTDRRGAATQMMFLEQKATWPAKPPSRKWQRPLRVGIVQSVIPDYVQYGERLDDPELINDPVLRFQQRRHLASLLEGVAQMLRVRETHRPQSREDGRILDLLVFPELAIHPLDVDTLILPFVRTHKCIILCGLVYHTDSRLPEGKVINSCLWMIPEWSHSAGFQVRQIEQGKQHLAAGEDTFSPEVRGFRPAQWQVEYQWHSDKIRFKPLVLSASICYDATDLELASDLRDRNDFYIVCALNKDVGTFDRMAEGLHYHMFQAVMVVNNGQFGGSNLFFPYRRTFDRQVLHLHGQPQAMIAFAEIDPQKLVNRPSERAHVPPEGQWKSPPAGWASF